VDILIPIFFILVGFILILAEVYLIPGFNVVGILGFLIVLFAIGYVFVEAGSAEGFMALLGSIAVGMLLFYGLWKSGAWNRFILATTLRHDEESVVREHEHRARYLGQSGVAVTPLRPTGIAEIQGDRIEVVTEGEFIAAGSFVRVVAMDKRRYFVRLSTAEKDIG